MLKKLVLTIFIFLVGSFSYAENNSIKVIGPLGLTRSFQNNVSSSASVIVKVKKTAGNVALKNIRNGKLLSPSLSENKKNNIFTFSNVSSGVWSIEIENVDDIISVNIG